MRKTDIAIYLVGEKFSENILWELKLAEKNGLPIFLIPINDTIDLADDRYSLLYKINDYDGARVLKYKTLSFVDFCELLKDKDEDLQKKLFTNAGVNEEALLEQYKLMLSTSESLVERRQKISNVYIAVCGVLIPIITTFIASTNLYMQAFAPFICLLTVFLCISWIKTITDYGKLNAAKFEIIEEIEKKLPLMMFGSEWIALSRRTKYYVSFTQREKFLPNTFIFLSCLLFVASIVILILKLVSVL